MKNEGKGNKGHGGGNKHRHGGGGGKSSRKPFVNKFLKKPGRFVKPVTGREFRREAKSAARLQFGPLQRQYEAEARASDLQQKNITGYFKDYENALKKVQAITGANYKNAQNYTAAQAAAAAKYSTSTNNQLNAQEAKSAKLRGATVSKSAQDNASKATGARYKSANNFGGMIATQGASQKSYLADKSRIATGEEAHQHLLESGTRRSIDQKLEEVARDKGALKADLLNKLRPQERDFYLALRQDQTSRKASKLSAKTSRQNAKLSAAVSRGNAKLSSRTTLKTNKQDNRQSNVNSQRTAATSRANSRRTARSSRRSDRIDARQFRKTHKHGHPLGTLGGGSDSGNGRQRQVAINRMVESLKSSTKNGQIVDDHGKPVSRHQVIAQLISHSQSSTPQQARIALRRWHQWLDKHPSNK